MTKLNWKKKMEKLTVNEKKLGIGVAPCKFWIKPPVNQNRPNIRVVHKLWRNLFQKSKNSK